jgi:hypothetical protein
MLHQVENQRRVSSVACVLERVAEQRRLSLSGVFTPPQGQDRRLSTLLSHGPGYNPGTKQVCPYKKEKELQISCGPILAPWRVLPGQNSLKWKILLYVYVILL